MVLALARILIDSRMTIISRLHNPKMILGRDGQLPAAIDAGRGIAALLVLLFHVRSALFAPYADFAPHNSAMAIFYTATSFGHAAVIVFFVLSGFLVGGAVLRMDAPARLPAYGLDRAVRIMPVTIGAIAVSLILATVQSARTGLPSCAANPAMIFGNLLNLQGFGAAVLCNNLALWSVSNEVSYYALFPVLAALCTGRRTYGFVVAGLIGLAALVFCLVATPLDERNVALYFPVWLLGSALWFKAVPRGKTSVMLPVFLVALLASRSDLARSWFLASDALLALSFAGLLGSLIGCPLSIPAWAGTMARPAGRLVAWLSGISFSLYVTHYPLVRFFADWGNDGGLNLPAHGISSGLAASFVLLTLVCLAFATLFSQVFEVSRAEFRQRIDVFLARARFGTRPVRS